MKKILIILMAAVLFSACSGTRNLTKARLDLPASFTGEAAVPPAADSLSLADLKWWEFYTDSTLTSIMRTALENNRDILKAAARVEQMRELYGVAKAGLLPEVGLNIGYSHETNRYNGGHTTKDPEFDLKFPISWEINLWGSLVKARNAGEARYLASVEDYRAMRMTLIAEVATAYFRLLSLENELSIVRQTLKTREEALAQAKLRFEGGLTSETVYQQAVVEYSTTASLIPDLELRVASMRNSLTTLMGEYPGESFKERVILFDADIAEKLPAGIPSGLLKRRPDLRAAERRLQAAMADVGVSYADRFPSLRIGLTPGFENDGLKDFFKSPFTYAIAQITGPLLDFGKRKRKYKAAVAAYDQSRYDYEKAVIGAFTEVNTSIIAYNRYRENHKVKSELRDAAAKYVQLAWLQYRGGTLNYLDVLDAQRRYFESQIGVNNASLNEYLALINLYKALGGGWS